MREVPALKVGRSVKAAETKTFMQYRGRRHEELAHVVKLSGGRSSAMMLAVLLENAILDRGRGDVVVFNNTGAEHPATYEFVRRCRELTASHGIGFFHTQFQTYEDARRGEWVRIPAYRLVNERPADKYNEDGFEWRGEPYEELVSWSGYIPNQFARSCTQGLKIDVTKRFVADWLRGEAAIPRIGHHGEGSRIDRDRAYKAHVANRGSMGKERFEAVRSYVWSRPHMRAQQVYEHYGGAGPVRQVQSGGCVVLVGLRADEQARAQRSLERSAVEPEAGHVYLPLWEMGIGRAEGPPVLGSPGMEPRPGARHQARKLRLLLHEGQGEPGEHRRGEKGGQLARIRQPRGHAERSRVVVAHRADLRQTRRAGALGVLRGERGDVRGVVRSGSGVRAGRRDNAPVRLHRLTDRKRGARV